MGAGRFVCVALPFGLTLASLICIMIAMLAGITNKNLDMFDVNTANLSISSSSLANLENLARRAAIPEDHFSGLTLEALANAAASTTTTTSTSTSSAINITASDLGLASSYKVSLWNYCNVTGSTVTCSKAKFNWASSSLNTTKIESTATSLTGVTVTLPKEVKSALKTFATVSKWTEVVYIIAIVTTAVELVIGIFAVCSRVGSCCTFLISGFSTFAIIVASIMVTAMSSTVVGTIDSVAKAYGVKASLNTSYLATTWVAVAFSLASGLFWMFSICCCAADHSSRKSSGGSPWRRNRDISDAEKIIPAGAYQRVHDNNETSYAGQQHGIYNPQTGVHSQQEYGVPSNAKAQRTTQGYEPYSHTAI